MKGARGPICCHPPEVLVELHEHAVHSDGPGVEHRSTGAPDHRRSERHSEAPSAANGSQPSPRLKRAQYAAILQRSAFGYWLCSPPCTELRRPPAPPRRRATRGPTRPSPSRRCRAWTCTTTRALPRAARAPLARRQHETFEHRPHADEEPRRDDRPGTLLD